MDPLSNTAFSAAFDFEAAALYDAWLARLRSGSRSGQQGGRFVEESVAALIPVSSTLRESLDNLTLCKGWLDSFRPLPVEVVEELRQFYTVSLTYNSNAIEGNTLTQSETEMVLSQGITVAGKSLVEHLEVIGHRDAMGYMEELGRANTPLTEREIKELHALILQSIEKVQPYSTARSEAGVYRTLDVRAAGTGYTYPPHYLLLDLMTEFCDWLPSKAAAALHPVQFASEAHFRFVSIHPFRDGNGRTARLLMNLLLLRAGYPITVIPNTLRADYIEALALGQSRATDSTAAARGEGDTALLTELVASCCRVSFIEYLRLLSTASQSRGRGRVFYQALLAQP